MSKKDYIQFAKMIKDELSNVQAPLPWDDGTTAYNEKAVIKSIAQKTADIFASDNPHFDRQRFMTACGFNE